MSGLMESSNVKKTDFPPSTELIPDEYDIVLDGRECVHIFVQSSFMVEKCLSFLRTLSISLEADCIHRLDNYGTVVNILDNAAKIPQKDKRLLLLLFWGNCEVDGEFILDDKKPLPFYTIWSKFCNGRWRNTPKLFLLNIVQIKRKIQHDGYFPYVPSEFKTPNEGDVLIIYKKNNVLEESKQFIDELGKKLAEYGKKENFLSIVTSVEISEQIKSRPVLISTLLKKLFLIPSEHRGEYFTFHASDLGIRSEIGKINSLLNKSLPIRIHESLSAENTGGPSRWINGHVDSDGSRRSSHTRTTSESAPRKSVDIKFNRATSSNAKRRSSVPKKEPWHI